VLFQKSVAYEIFQYGVQPHPLFVRAAHDPDLAVKEISGPSGLLSLSLSPREYDGCELIESLVHVV